MRRRVTNHCGIGLLIAISFGCTEPALRPERIVLIVVDTLRQDVLSRHGGWGSTPNLNSLAASGQRFPNAVASFHQTTMSMGAMFTGRTPSLESGDESRPIEFNGRNRCGLARFRESDQQRSCIPETLDTLPEILRGADYWTMGITSNALLFSSFGIGPGFDDWSEIGDVPRSGRSRMADAIKTRTAENVNAAVEEALDRRRDDNFFLYVHYMDAHDYMFRKIANKRVVGPKKTRLQYSQAVKAVDDAIAELLEMLRERNLFDGSVIVFVSDHGERLVEQHFVRGGMSHKGNPSFEEVLRVPVIVSPAQFDDTSRVVRSEDIFRMVTAIAGIDPDVPADLEPGELFVSETKWQIYRKGRWKSYTSRRRSKGYLVDLEADPGETRDVSEEHPSVVEDHRRRVKELSKQLAAQLQPREGLTEEDRDRLRALGYLETLPETESPQSKVLEAERAEKRGLGMR
jgi:arylsulfatase A-like enzyme